MSYRPDPAMMEAYQCGACRASSVKLWRQYQTFSPSLICAGCLEAQEGLGPHERFNPEGARRDRRGMITDQAGWFVPAVPDEEGQGFWGYTAVPEPGVRWWKGRPTRLPRPAETVDA